MHPPPAWYDEQYNNRARIPEHLSILQHWSDESTRTRDRLRSRLDLPYGSDERGRDERGSDERGRDASERLDVFLPDAPVRDAPVLVYIHGGYWRALDKRDQSFVAAPFAAAGAITVLPNYALCPAVTIEQIALQLVRALAWVHRHIAEHGGDPRRIVVAGHSAGGHLAALLLACDWRAVAADLPSDLLAGALSISGLFELEPLRHTPFLAGDLRLTEASAARLSPAWMPAPRGPLVSIVGGDESEEFLRQHALIADAWGDAVIGEETVAGRHHMNVLHEIADSTSRTHQWALRLLGLPQLLDPASPSVLLDAKASARSQ